MRQKKIQKGSVVSIAVKSFIPEEDWDITYLNIQNHRRLLFVQLVRQLSKEKDFCWLITYKSTGKRLWNVTFAKKGFPQNVCWRDMLGITQKRRILSALFVHRYFVDNVLSCGLPLIRSQVLHRYASFARSLLASPSKEVAIVARISAMDASSNTGLNIRMETGMCPLTGTASSLKEELYKPMTVPEQDEWSTLKWGTHWSQASQAQSILMSSLPVFARASRSVSNMEKPWKQNLFFFYLLDLLYKMFEINLWWLWQTVSAIPYRYWSWEQS